MSIKVNFQQNGFTFIELISILVIVSVISVTFLSRTTPTDTFQLQASRDQLVAAFFSAQQKAMVQTQAIQLSTSGQTIDIRQDTNSDGNFSTEPSLSIGGVTYPWSTRANQSFSDSTFVFNRLGQTTAGTVSVSMGENRVLVNVSATGFAE